MSSSPLVSIVIPCFNRENYIETAVNSALEQTYKNIEVIVVDDGSTDNSLEVLSQYEDKISLITQENKGVSAARNTGISAVNGEFIIFLDSDDWLSNDLVENHIKTAEKFPYVDIYCSDFKGVDEGGVLSSLVKSQWPDEPAVPVELFLLYPPPFPACEMYRTEAVLKHGGYDSEMKGFADSILRINIILSGGKVVRTPNGHAVYRRVENSITRSTKLHYFAVKLIRKLKMHPEVVKSKYLQSLIDKRLFKHRLRIWNNVLSFHTKIHPVSWGKFFYHLSKTLKMDVGYIVFIFRDRPWGKRGEEFF
jgi:glycosyltransferase involved in cell wall biosynthesis